MRSCPFLTACRIQLCTYKEPSSSLLPLAHQHLEDLQSSSNRVPNHHFRGVDIFTNVTNANSASTTCRCPFKVAQYPPTALHAPGELLETALCHATWAESSSCRPTILVVPRRSAAPVGHLPTGHLRAETPSILTSASDESLDTLTPHRHVIIRSYLDRQSLGLPARMHRSSRDDMDLDRGDVAAGGNVIIEA